MFIRSWIEETFNNSYWQKAISLQPMSQNNFSRRWCEENHIAEKPIPCNQCLKWFFEGGSSKTHLRTHYSEKSFLCKEVIWINILELILAKSLFLANNVIKLFSNRWYEQAFKISYWWKTFSLQPMSWIIFWRQFFKDTFKNSL